MDDLSKPLATWEVRYCNEGDPLSDEWRDDGSFADCHHGFYSTRIVSTRHRAEEGGE